MATRIHRWYLSAEEAKRSHLFQLRDTDREDDRVRTAIRGASAIVERALDTWFYPRILTRYYDHPQPDADILELGQWLLSVTTFTTENTNNDVVATDYFLVHTAQDPDHNKSPYRLVIMNPDGDYPYLEWSGTKRKANAIAGVWGYGDDSEDTGATVLNNPLAIGGTSLTVLTGLLETGWMLLIEDEQVFASAVSEGDPNDTVTIVRARGGTTAAAHVATTAISRYVPPYDIELLTGILAARLFHRGTASWADIIGTRETARQFVKAMAAEASYVLDMYLEDTYFGASGFVPWDLLDG